MLVFAKTGNEWEGRTHLHHGILGTFLFIPQYGLWFQRKWFIIIWWKLKFLVYLWYMGLVFWPSISSTWNHKISVWVVCMDTYRFLWRVRNVRGDGSDLFVFNEIKLNLFWFLNCISNTVKILCILLRKMTMV